MRRCILATCAIILVAGLCLDARAADVRTKSGSKQPVFSPTGVKGSKIDKPLNPDQIKKMVKKKMKQDHASINLFELILFRNRQVKETVPEKSCFKYNLAALGFALNSFADTINSVEFANSKNALPAEVIFSFQANGIRMPDVVKTNLHTRLDLLFVHHVHRDFFQGDGQVIHLTLCFVNCAELPLSAQLSDIIFMVF